MDDSERIIKELERINAKLDAFAGTIYWLVGVGAAIILIAIAEVVIRAMFGPNV
ncbi:hypothetical protein [Candidatus Binatus sp.]|jgi:hypothetical protein|uniref:hypothetical protein n=1 Tax=Candidatus Binatus sp. TaxID=2811406 RepID=UPI003BCD8B80